MGRAVKIVAWKLESFNVESYQPKNGIFLGNENILQSAMRNLIIGFHKFSEKSVKSLEKFNDTFN